MFIEKAQKKDLVISIILSWLDGEDLTGPDGFPRTKKEGARGERKFPTNESEYT